MCDIRRNATPFKAFKIYLKEILKSWTLPYHWMSSRSAYRTINDGNFQEIGFDWVMRFKS